MPANPEQQAALDALKRQVAEYYERFLRRGPFVPGVSTIPVSGKVFDAREMELLLEASLDGWWTEGRFTEQVQIDLAKYLGARYLSLCNSGSSANLLAVTSLTSRIHGERRLKPGDEVIGVAAGFPTTVAPVVQNQL